MPEAASARGRALSGWAGLALVVAPAAARASVFDTYGFGARGAAMAGAQTAAAEDFSAVYYNPAALTVHKHPHVGTALTLVAPSCSLERDASGLAPSGLTRGTPSPAAGPAPATETPDPNLGITLGLLFPLGGKIQNKFALGIGLYLPTIQVTRVDALDAATPQWYRYEALPDKIVIVPGLAYEIVPMLSVGLGMQVLGSLNGAADVDLDLLSQRFTRKNLKVDVDTATGLTAGLLFRPTDTLRFGFSYRNALALDYHLRTDIRIQEVGHLVADISGTSLFTPTQYTWGAAWQPLGEAGGLTVAADVLWARWSQAPDPTAHFDVTLDGNELNQGSLEARSGRVDLGAVDTVSPRLGVEYQPTADWALRAGYQLSPTPLPAQTGRTNYIDSTAHQLGLGAGYSFADPLEIHDSPLTIDLSAQWTHLQDRKMRKSSPTDPLGDYTAGGELLSFNLTLRHDFR